MCSVEKDFLKMQVHFFYQDITIQECLMSHNALQKQCICLVFLGIFCLFLFFWLILKEITFLTIKKRSKITKTIYWKLTHDPASSLHKAPESALHPFICSAIKALLLKQQIQHFLILCYENYLIICNSRRSCFSRYLVSAVMNARVRHLQIIILNMYFCNTVTLLNIKNLQDSFFYFVCFLLHLLCI